MTGKPFAIAKGVGYVGRGLVQGYPSFPLMDRVIHWHVNQVPFISLCTVHLQHNSLSLLIIYSLLDLQFFHCDKLRSQCSLSGLEAGPITSFLSFHLKTSIHVNRKHAISLSRIAIQDVGMALPTPKLAFAGLGAMGYGMATHLLKSGYAVTGSDVYQPALDRFLTESPSASTARTPKEAAENVEFFICMVANFLQATPLLFDDEKGTVKGLKKDASIIMCSTVAPAYIDEIQQRLTEMGRDDIKLIDAPVSGGAARAAAGTLSIFASGSRPDLENARSVLECMSGKLYEIPGGLGGGSKAKLIHQIFAGVHIAMASEAMGLAARAGLDTREVFGRVRESEGSSWMFENRVPHMLEKGKGGYSSMTIIAKDVVCEVPCPLLLAILLELCKLSFFGVWQGICHCSPYILPIRINRASHKLDHTGHHNPNSPLSRLSPPPPLHRRTTLPLRPHKRLGRRRRLRTRSPLSPSQKARPRSHAGLTFQLYLIFSQSPNHLYLHLPAYPYTQHNLLNHPQPHDRRPHSHHHRSHALLRVSGRRQDVDV